VIARLIFAAIIASAQIAIAEPHAGFEVSQHDGAVFVSDVHECSPSYFTGVVVGDKLIESGGKAIKTEEDLRAAVSKRSVGKLMAFHVIRNDKRTKVLVRVIDSMDVRRHVEQELRDKAADEQRARERAEETARRAAALAERTRDYVEKHGPLLYVGRVTEDVIGQPEILLVADNISSTAVEAVRFRVAVFDKFGDEAKNAFSGEHETVFLYQRTIRPGAEAVIRMGIPWHATAGKATVIVTEYVVNGGVRVSPPRPKVVEITNER
jgi:hypothetical protein